MPRADIANALSHLDQALRNCQFDGDEADEEIRYFSHRSGMASADLTRIAAIAKEIKSRLEAKNTALQQILDETRRTLRHAVNRIPSSGDGSDVDTCSAEDVDDVSLDDDDLADYPRIDGASADLDDWDLDDDDDDNPDEKVG
jgi:hypothetical protein